MLGSTGGAGMGDERDDAANRLRADVYSSARIGAAAALTLVLAFLAGVVMGGTLDRFVLPLLVDAWIDRLRRHGR